MCGITGYYGDNNINLNKYYKAHLLLKHRGPDDEGFILKDKDSEIICAKGIDTIPFFSNLKSISSFKKSNFILGHRRLSIIDLTEKGHQPITDDENRYYLVFNGEIFNYIELMEELSDLGHQFNCKNDTEVFLKSFIEWGVNCFNKFNGMWAAAVYDSKKDELLLSRDRFGIKPLYYYVNNNDIFFGSEVKFILSFIDKIDVNSDLVREYIVDSSLDHQTKTMFKDIYQLKPGNYIVINSNGIKTKSFWNYTPKVNKKLKYEETVNELGKLFSNSIDLRLRSDVPVGSLLSGGLDSTAIVCDIHKRYNKKIYDFKTFSAVFEEKKYSEDEYIDKTIKQTNFSKNFIIPDPNKICEEIDKILYYQEFPFRSLSVYSQWCIYKYISENSDVIVLLNGQGSDEIFGGYTNNYYSYLAEKIRKMEFVSFIKEFFNISQNRKIPKKNILFNVAAKFIGQFGFELPLFLTRKKICKNSYKRKKMKTSTNNIFLQDLYSNLRFKALPEYLRYEDRNSMAFSLEARLPFMDYRIVELGYTLPDEFKIKNGISKRIIRDIARSYSPSEIITRKDKMGFVSPAEIWLRTILTKEISQPLEDKKFIKDYLDFLDMGQIKEKFKKYLSQDSEDEDILLFWRIYCFYKWKQLWIDNKMNSCIT
jgi:asparagine synthase (glutamine-hydrolysing)